jgi:hypothetical protein
MLSLINLAQREYVRLTRVLQSFAYTSTIQGQADYPMPADWLGSEKVFYNSAASGSAPNWRPLQATNLEKLGQENPNFLSTDSSMQGSPSKFYIIGSTLYLFPKPQASGSNDLFMFYESTAPALSVITDALAVDDSLYPGVRAYVLAKLWKQDNELERAAEEMENFKAEIGNGRKWKNKRILDGKWQMDIQSHIPYSYGSNFGSGAGINPLNM